MFKYHMNRLLHPAQKKIMEIRAASSVTSLADAFEEAQNRIAELLQHPDDLNSKLKSLQNKFTAEKAAIDTVLKTSVQSQIDDTFDGLKLLSNAHQLVDSIKDNLGMINGICSQKSDIRNYPRIKKISRTHQNFQATKAVVIQFQDLNKDIEKLNSLLQADSKDILSHGSPNLLYIHYHVFRLEEFRDATMQKAKSQGASVLQIVTKYFKRLDLLSEKFKSHLWNISKNLLTLIRENQGSLVVRLGKIIDAEERTDEKVLTSEQIRSSNKDLNKASQEDGEASNYEWKSMAINPRVVRNYRSQMFAIILDQITLDFHAVLAKHEKSVFDSLQACTFVYDDLMIVFNEIAPRFPPKYKIFDFFVLQYHKQVYDLINKLTGYSNLEPRDILEMTRWVREYYSIMGDRFSVSEELLEPRLMDDKEDDLNREFVKLTKVKLYEWANRLIDEERAEFKKRDRPPVQTVESETVTPYTTDTIVIFFQMITQQVETTLTSARGTKLLLDTIIECFKLINYYQEKATKMLEEEEAAFLAGANIPGGFPEYVMALSNNHLKGLEYIETVQKRIQSTLDEKYQVEASKFANESLEGFVKVSRRGYTCLISIVFKDINPAFQQVFSPAWYDSYTQHNTSIMASILTTLEDYMQDYQKHLSDYLFSKLTTDCLEKFILAYVECFRAKSTKFKMQKFGEFARADLQASVSFWNVYKAPKRVKQSFDIIEKIISVIDSSDTMLFLSWYSMWKTYNDVPLAFIEDLWSKRDDLDKSAIKETIVTCKDKSKESNMEAATSIFSKIFPSVQTAAVKP